MEELINSMGEFGTMWPILLMVVIFYFLLYRPQKKQQKHRQQMLDSLKKGAKVITVGGIYGTIETLDEKTATLRISEKVEVKVTRSAINQVLGKDSEDAENDK